MAMASRFTRLAMRRSSALIMPGTATPESFRFNNRRTIVARSSLSTASGSVGDDDRSPLRRRRRRGAKDDDRTTPSAVVAGRRFVPGESVHDTDPGGGGAFAPKDAEGNLLDAQEYLSLASLSPWVPCPDVVIKRVFEIADASSEDVHADLGCGDGRLNFAAVGDPYHMDRSWGVDVDSNILGKCRERIGRRFVPAGFGVRDELRNDGDSTSPEAERLEFLQADLIRVIERQKEKHQRQQLLLQDGSSPSAEITDQDDKGADQPQEDWSKEDEITQKLTQTTIITMYFVHDALQQLQPYLASVVGEKENVRVITVGYEMKGWDAAWVERVLGLTIFKYDMKHVSNDPLEWKVGEEGGEEESSYSSAGSSKDNGPNTSPVIDFGDGYADVDGEDGDGALAKYLQQKRESDMEELNAGLRIHHDEALNDFAQSRSKQQHGKTHHQVGGGGNSSSSLEDTSEVEEEWDFDENEDPEVLMKEAQKIMAEARRGARGQGRKGMMAGLDDAGKGGKKKKKKKKKGTKEGMSCPGGD